MSSSPPSGYLDVKVGYRCNNDCVHCVIRDNEAALIEAGKPTDCTTAECLAIIADAARRGLGSITLTGGEPTIRPDFFELLEACRDAGLAVGVQTNGRRFHDPGFCARLKDCGTPGFVIALHGSEAATHDAISRRPGSFEQTTRGIRNLCDGGYNVVGKLVISRLNAGQLVGTMKIMINLRVRGACFAYPHGQGSARVHYPDIAPRYRDIRPEIDALTAAAGAAGFDLSLEAFPLCVLSEPQYVAELSYLQQQNRRCIPSHDKEYDWDELRPLDKRKFPQCAACACDPYCEGPWKEYPETYGDAEFQPLPPDALLNLLATGLTSMGSVR